MKTMAVIATGPSLTIRDVQRVREHNIDAVAVSNAYTLAPWAVALVSHDLHWWNTYKDAWNFPGQKFCGSPFDGLKYLLPAAEFTNDCNSGLMGMRVARDYFHATRLLLLGFDLHNRNGAHFFGKHPKPLSNTPMYRFVAQINQFKRWKIKTCEVINCTPGSDLKRFPIMTLEEALCSILGNGDGQNSQAVRSA